MFQQKINKERNQQYVQKLRNMKIPGTFWKCHQYLD